MAKFSDFINWALEKCADSSVGYSMDFRYEQKVTYSEALKHDESYSGYACNYHYDFINYAGTGATIIYYDCSSFVSYALMNAGFSLSVFETSNECNTLEKLGWKRLDNGEQLKQGDIGWRSGGHTEICYQGGKAGESAIFMGAHGRNTSAGSYSTPKPLPYQVSIGNNDGNESYHYSSFTRFYRYYDWEDEEIEPPSTVEPKNLYVCSAIIGNFWQESTLSPTIWENLNPRAWSNIWQSGVGSGYGLGGWTNIEYNGTIIYNLLDLYNWCVNSGLDVSNGEVQIRYLLEADNHWNVASSMADYDKILCHTWNDFWNSEIENLYQLTYDFFRCWEGINDSSFDERLNYAQMAFDYIPQHLDDENITTWYTGNRYLSTDESLNNCVLIYRFIQRYIGADDTVAFPADESEQSGQYGDTGTEPTKEEEVTWSSLLNSALGMNKNRSKNLKVIFNDRK